MMSASSSRRRLIKSSAAAALLAPFVPAALRRAEAAPPRRLVLVFTPSGVPQGKLYNNVYWGATGTETQFTFGKTLAPLEPYKKDLLLLEGIDIKSWRAQQPSPSNDHPPVLGHVLTANNVIDPRDGSNNAISSTWFAGHISIDQMIANRIGSATRDPSLVLGVQSGGHLARLSYRGAKDPVPPRSDPKNLFDYITAAIPTMPGNTAAADRLRAQRKSVLDGVLEELRDLEGRLPAEDKPKIQAHLTRLRDLEMRLASSSKVVTGCRAPTYNVSATEPAFVAQGRQQMDNLAAILACDLTRVVHLQWTVAGSGMHLPWLGVNTPHHTIAHNPGTEPTIEIQSTIGAWYAGQFRYLLDRLREIPESDGTTVLDNTAVLWYSEHGTPHAGHPRENLPLLMAGRAGGAFRPGRWLKFKNAAHSDLFISLAHAMGLTDVTTFGNPAVATGPLPGLG